MRALLFLFFSFLCFPSFSQLDFNIGISPGLNISGIANKQTQTFLTHNQKSVYSQSTRPVYSLSNGLFGEVAWKNLSLKLNVIYHQTGATFKEELKVITGNGPDHVTAISDFFKLDYLSFPIELEVRFKIKKIRANFTLGLNPSKLLNIQHYLERMDGSTLTFSEQDDYEEYYGQYAYLLQLNEFENPLIFGFGFYLNPRISLAINYSKSANNVFCRNTSSTGFGCDEYYRNKTIRLSLNMRLQQQNFTPFWKSLSKKKKQNPTD